MTDIVERPIGPREWLIRKNGYFYRPNRSGYTTKKIEAGRYTEAEARREADVEPWNISAVHQGDVPDEPAVVDMTTLIASQAARIRELEDGIEWYGEQARLARLIHSGGVLAEARAALAAAEAGEPVGWRMWRFNGEDRWDWPDWLKGHNDVAYDLDWSRAGASHHIKDAEMYVYTDTMRADIGDWIGLAPDGKLHTF